MGEAFASCASPLFAFLPLDHPRPPGSLDAWMPLGTRCNSRDTGCVGALGKLSSPAWSLFLLLRDLVV